MVGPVIDGVLTNNPSMAFDFATYEYQVCLLDMMFMPGSWDNVRAGANKILLKNKDSVIAKYVKPGHYPKFLDFVGAINEAL